MLTQFCFCFKLRFFFFMESIRSPYNDKFEIRVFMTITRIPEILFIQIKEGVTYLVCNESITQSPLYFFGYNSMKHK